jgi:hypothetical protein
LALATRLTSAKTPAHERTAFPASRPTVPLGDARQPHVRPRG